MLFQSLKQCTTICEEGWNFLSMCISSYQMQEVSSRIPSISFRGRRFCISWQSQNGQIQVSVAHVIDMYYQTRRRQPVTEHSSMSIRETSSGLKCTKQRWRWSGFTNIKVKAGLMAKRSTRNVSPRWFFRAVKWRLVYDRHVE